MRRGAIVFALAGALIITAPMAALAEPLEPFLERSAAADFTGQQVVACETPAGPRTVAIELSQSDGVTTARNAVGGGAQVQMAGGSFSVTSDEGMVDTSASLSTSLPENVYSVSLVRNVQVLGRAAQRVTVVDGSDMVRASMTFDVATGAMLAAQLRNADQSVYCDIKMVDFAPVVGRSRSAVRDGNSSTLEPIEALDDARLPDGVGAFTRLETYDWERGGVIAYYSDGLFSFALLATDRPIVLDDATAELVEIDGDDYTRWFGAGQVIYVWETAEGGLTMYGDLPLDLQSEVLGELPEPQRTGMLTRWWRNIFG